MKKVKFSNNEVYETYSSEEYDRSNYDIPTLLLRKNAMDFGGAFLYEYNNIFWELAVLKRSLEEAYKKERCGQ